MDKPAGMGKCVFLTTGTTYIFREVTGIHEDSYTLSFTYKSASDGLIKSATFYKIHVAGHSEYEL